MLEALRSEASEDSSTPQLTIEMRGQNIVIRPPSPSTRAMPSRSQTRQRCRRDRHRRDHRSRTCPLRRHVCR